MGTVTSITKRIVLRLNLPFYLVPRRGRERLVAREALTLAEVNAILTDTLPPICDPRVNSRTKP